MGVMENSMWILLSLHTRWRREKALSPSWASTETGFRIHPSSGTSSFLSASHRSILSKMVAQEMETVTVMLPPVS